MRAPGEYEYTLSLSSAMVALLGHVLECRHAHQKEEERRYCGAGGSGGGGGMAPNEREKWKWKLSAPACFGVNVTDEIVCQQ